MKKYILIGNIPVDENGNFRNIFEVLYEVKKGKAILLDINNKEIKISEELEKYLLVYEKLKDRGYIIGSGLKFGGLFRIYENPNEHSKWVCYIYDYKEKFIPYEFLSKNRVAHSTRKKLLLAIFKEKDLIFIESRWKRF